MREALSPPVPPAPLAVMAMSAIRGLAGRKIRGGEWRPLSAFEERHDVVVVERKVREGVSVEEIWKEYEAARLLLSIAEATGDEFKARKQRERVGMLESELRDAVMDENLIEDSRGWY